MSMALTLAMSTLLATATGCSKQTPGLCCTDEADCGEAGLSAVTACDDGLACRGHQCVAEVCGSSADCNATALYCADQGTNRGLCAASCSDDTECPGAAQAAGDRLCVSGECAQCRIDDDCPAGTPVCETGVCRGCVAHAECATHVCTPNGSCATEDQIAHVAPSGASTGDCGALAPCSLSYALGSQPPHGYILFAPGTYTSAIGLTVVGKQVMIGDRGARPVITRSTPGAILEIGPSAEVELDGIEVSGATSGSEQGDGIACRDMSSAGAATVRLTDVLVRNNVIGVEAYTCMVIAVRTTFEANGDGAHVFDLGGSFDRCTFDSNMGMGLDEDGAVVNVTNSFFYRNWTGISVFAFEAKPGSTFAFNTIVDNTTGIDCMTNALSPATFANNIIARNATNIADGTPAGYSCTYPGSIITGDVGPLRFVQPDVAPYDYHISAGSSAIDAAMASTVDHDFDGEARPKGNGRDIGADEAK
ncbi:MAG TPA: right-handed parallel beta-helix repeat-containing protein [Kofleriaceae bacterium]